MKIKVSKFSQPSRRNMPGWLAYAPWAVALACLGLALVVLGIDFSKSARESEIAATVYLERGAAMIQAYEATLRTGLGFQWTDAELQGVLDSLGTTPSIQFMAVLDENGQVIAASQAQLLDTALFGAEQMRALASSETVKGLVLQIEQDGQVQDSFLIYRSLGDRYQMRPPGMTGPGMAGQGMMGRQGMGHHEHRFGIILQSPGMERQNLSMFIAYDLEYLRGAQAADQRNLRFKILLLTGLGLAGLLALALALSYRKSRALVRESTAFTYALFDNLPLGIIALDAKQSITSCNPEAARLVAQSEQNLLGAKLAEALPGLWQVLASYPDQLQAGQELEARVPIGGQSWAPLGITVAPIGLGHELLGQAIMLRDLGELRRLQAELQRQDRLAALGSMAAGVAHEIRNPLGAIKGLARFFLESWPENSQEAKMAQVMTSEVLRLDKVVGDLLELSRPGQLQLGPVALPALLDKVLQMANQDLRSRNIEARLELPEHCPRPLLDADRLIQVLLNLVLNAAQAMPDGGSLVLRAAFEQSAHSAPGCRQTWLRLEVQDSGKGIATEDLQLIFSPYYTTKAKGTGLGLSLVQKIVEAHQGEIEVKSTPGLGTLFVIRLPLNLSSEEDDFDCANQL